MTNAIDIFTQLGTKLSEFGHTERSKEVIASAIEHNSWFTYDDILRAVEAIRTTMLDRDRLHSWITHYPTVTHSERVAIIMAGNIPLVGFFDLLCVVCSGHRAYVKPSSKDRVLMEYVIEELRCIDSTIPIYQYNPDEHYDIAIATGGEQANEYFRQHFAGTRHLLRGTRHSIAILDGKENEEELNGLVRDITAYSGLGCRSVSMLFIPEGYTLKLRQCEPANRKLRNTLVTHRALLTMQQRDYQDFGAFIAVASEEFPQSLAEVSIQRYGDISEVKEWIAKHRDTLQCIVTHTDICGAIPFGEAQYPTLSDYADGIDTMLFLSSQQ